MKKLILSYVLMSLIAFSSCKKETASPIVVDDDYKLKTIWEYPFPDSLSSYGSMEPLLFENLILSSYQSLDSSMNEVVIGLNKETGELLWEWDEYIRPAPQKVRGSQKSHINNGIIALCSSQDNYGIGINTGSSIWSTNNENGGSRISGFDQVLYHTETFGLAPNGDSSNILIGDINTGDWQNVVGLAKTDEYEVRLGTPAQFITDESDTLIVFQNRQFTFSSTVEKADLYCYNLSDNEMLWEKENISSSGSTNNRAPIINDGKLYFAGKWDLICIEMPSGEELWRHNYHWSYQGSNTIVFNDLIINVLDNGDLIALNKNNGDLVWLNEALTGCCTELRIYGDRVYFGNTKIYIVNANDGSLLYKFDSPNPGGSFINAVAVDLAHNKMYTSDGRYLMCMELPE